MQALAAFQRKLIRLEATVERRVCLSLLPITTTDNIIFSIKIPVQRFDRTSASVNAQHSSARVPDGADGISPEPL